MLSQSSNFIGKSAVISSSIGNRANFVLTKLFRAKVGIWPAALVVACRKFDVEVRCFVYRNRCSKLHVFRTLVGLFKILQKKAFQLPYTFSLSLRRKDRFHHDFRL